MSKFQSLWSAVPQIQGKDEIPAPSSEDVGSSQAKGPRTQQPAFYFIHPFLGFLLQKQESNYLWEKKKGNKKQITSRMEANFFPQSLLNTY